MARALSLGVLALLSLASLCAGQPLPVKKQVAVVKKQVVAVKKQVRRTLPPVQVDCKVAAMNDPFRVVTCKFVSRLQVPVCPKFTCDPPPTGACMTGPGAGGISNQACSWSISPNCSVPTPVYPSRGNSFGFGWITTDPRPVTVKIAGFQRVGFRGTLCPN